MIRQYQYLIITLMLILSLSSNIIAQIRRPHILLGANISYNKPQGSFAAIYKLGVGAEAFGGIGSKKTFLMLTTGTATFLSENKNYNSNLNSKAIKTGIRQFVFSKKIFIQGDLGIAYLKDKTTGTNDNRFLKSLGAGVRLLGLEGGIYYNSWRSVDANGSSNSVQAKIGWSKVL